ncbi:ABC transporter ATP-binding protein [Mesorhizobium sp. CU2]|uniref:ABC transporter ATP-binding protein n=1 Tax=unclassified Mesorhizobium TaxID=325217 RepID=UPI001127F5F7|nr:MULTISPECIES: ABC transporter ATP-binding protein [unclassified Mesorhizobium]TPN81133.1 ABC transporter ATP-binding protein [Mesorhizobium sp. CU3]TPO17068.1 ABC transporter ATP-binding protein [Mesorhizobium sp. CU2]
MNLQNPTRVSDQKLASLTERPNVLGASGRGIRYDGISKRYGGALALKPTYLDIEPGEFFAIIGPSGSGKTTLLGVTAGFIAATEGHILIDGKSIEGVPPFKRNIGMVFQNYSLFPHKTVGQNIAFPLQMRGVPKADIWVRVRDALKLVRLDDFVDRYPSALSGGQQQRVALARAAVYNPSLLVMDEPLSALDKNLREEMQYEIKQLHAKLGSTVLYVTHDQSEAAAMAHRIAIMNGGEIVQMGSARELYLRPRNRFVASFLGQANLLHVSRMERSEAGLIVDTDCGLRLRSSAVAGDDEDCCVCIRPEAIRIFRTRPDTDNVQSGIVIDSMFTNGVQRHRIGVHPDVIIEQWQQISSESFASEMGETVFLGWNANDTLIVSNT